MAFLSSEEWGVEAFLSLGLEGADRLAQVFRGRNKWGLGASGARLVISGRKGPLKSGRRPKWSWRGFPPAAWAALAVCSASLLVLRLRVVGAGTKPADTHCLHRWLPEPVGSAPAPNVVLALGSGKKPSPGSFSRAAQPPTSGG